MRARPRAASALQRGAGAGPRPWWRRPGRSPRLRPAGCSASRSAGGWRSAARRRAPPATPDRRDPPFRSSGSGADRAPGQSRPPGRPFRPPRPRPAPAPVAPATRRADSADLRRALWRGRPPPSARTGRDRAKPVGRPRQSTSRSVRGEAPERSVRNARRRAPPRTSGNRRTTVADRRESSPAGEGAGRRCRAPGAEPPAHPRARISCHSPWTDSKRRAG